MFIYCICTQYLVGAHFALITASIRVAWRLSVCGTEVVWKPRFLWQWPSAYLHFLDHLHFPLDNTHRFSLGFRSGEFAGQSSTPTPWSFNQLLVLLAVWTGARSCWKMKSASLKSWSAEGSMKCSKMLVNGCSDVGFQKTQWTNTTDDIAPQIITDCGN